MKRERFSTTALAALAVGLAGLLGSCDDAPAAPARGLTVASDGEFVAASGTMVTTFRLEGTDVASVTIRLLRIQAGAADTIRERVYDSPPPSLDAALTILEGPGAIHGQDHRRDFEIIETLDGENHGFDDGPATCLGVRDGGSQCVRDLDVEPGTATILWARTLWPVDGNIPGGRRFDTVEDARRYTAEDDVTVVLATLTWK